MADNNVKIIISAVDNASKNVKNVEGSFSKLNKGFQQLTGLSLGTAGGIALVGTAIQKAGKFVADSVNDWQKYVQQVKEMSLATGTGAEEMSKIIQVADDWGIEAGELQSAMVMMNKNGMQPSIENLAILADKYQATSDKQAYAAELTKIFGRNYSTLIPLLAQGGDAIRANADAIADNMIVTDESIQQSEEYRKEVDELSDSWTGLKNTIGRAVVPALADVVGGINDTIKSQQDYNKALEQYTALVNAGVIPAQKESLGFVDEYGNEVYSDTTPSLEALNQQLEDYYASLDNGWPSEARFVTNVGNMGQAADDAADSISRVGIAIGEMTMAAAAKDAIDALTQSYKDGTLKADVYHNKVAEIMRRYLDLPEAEITAQLALQDLKEQLEDGTITADEYAAAVINLQTNLDNLDGTEAHTTITTDHIDNWISQGIGGEHHRASGGPVSGGEPYIVGENGPEVFVPPHNGTIYNQQQYNFNYHTNASDSNIMRDFRISQAMAG